ncbi:uncharacterized protein DS421_11g336100 [Arachis hypogaea]|nr:uncharacterized protein DS421_11g336100 [Arachis hypogaea]
MSGFDERFRVTKAKGEGRRVKGEGRRVQGEVRRVKGTGLGAGSGAGLGSMGWSPSRHAFKMSLFCSTATLLKTGRKGPFGHAFKACQKRTRIWPRFERKGTGSLGGGGRNRREERRKWRAEGEGDGTEKKREKWIVIGEGGDCRRREPSLRAVVEYTDQRETRAVTERKLRPHRRSIVAVEANLVVVESSLLNRCYAAIKSELKKGDVESASPREKREWRGEAERMVGRLSLPLPLPES